MYDWDTHRQRLIRDYKERVPWQEILERNKTHELRASKRTCQNKLRQWGYLDSARDQGYRLVDSEPLTMAEHQDCILPSGPSQRDHRITTIPLSPSQLLDQSLSEQQLKKFNTFLSEERQKDEFLPRLRWCCQWNVQPDFPCRWCSIDYVHRLAINAPSLPMAELRTLVARSQQHINKEDHFGNIPLHFLAASGGVDLDHLILYIEAGAKIQHQNTRGETFLHSLQPSKIQDRLPEFLDYLWLRGFHFGQRDIFGSTALHRLCEYDLAEGIYQKICRLFDDKGVLRDHRDCFGRSPELLREQTKRAKTIVEHSLRPHEPTNERNKLDEVTERRFSESTARNPMLLAVSKALCQREEFDAFENTQARVLRMQDVIERSATNSKSEDEFGNSALHCLFWISYFGNLPEDDVDACLGQLLLYGLNVNDFNKSGSTPLHTLISLPFQLGDDKRTCRYMESILAKPPVDEDDPFNVELRDFDGQTILFLACLNGQIECVRALLDRKANPHVRNFEGNGILAECDKMMEFCQTDSEDNSLNESLRKNAAVLLNNIRECRNLVNEQAVEDPNSFLQWGKAGFPLS